MSNKKIIALVTVCATAATVVFSVGACVVHVCDALKQVIGDITSHGCSSLSDIISNILESD